MTANCRAPPCSKLNQLGWRERTSWEDGLRKTVDWYLSNGFTDYWDHCSEWLLQYVQYILVACAGKEHDTPAELLVPLVPVGSRCEEMKECSCTATFLCQCARVLPMPHVTSGALAVHSCPHIGAEGPRLSSPPCRQRGGGAGAPPHRPGCAVQCGAVRWRSKGRPRHQDRSRGLIVYPHRPRPAAKAGSLVFTRFFSTLVMCARVQKDV